MQLSFPRRTLLLATALAAGSALLQACGGSDDEPERNIVQRAQAHPELSILVEAVVAAGLVDTLSTGTLTVFAPTNAAFAALLTELGVSKAELLANKPLLTTVLTYHVLPARVLKAELPVGTAIKTVQGESFSVNANLQITDRKGRSSQITATDVFTRNGVIHVVDRVLLPA